VTAWLLAVAVAAGSWAADYRNQPEWQKLVGFQWAALSPRATVAADSLRARGASPVAWVQPLVCTWQGQFIASWPWDKATLEVAQQYGAILPNTISGDDINGCHLLDFTKPGFPAALASAHAGLLEDWHGVLLDYGCRDISWEHSLGEMPAGFWDQWADGWAEYKAVMGHHLDGPVICQCDRWDGLEFHCDGLLWEKVGWTLNPPQKVWQGLLTGHPGVNVVLYPGPGGTGKRMAAGMALARDAAFSWRNVSDPWTPQRNEEHFSLTVGEFYRDAWQRAPDVWQRIGTHGQVIINFSDTPYRYGSRTIAPGDALVIQHRDVITGRFMKWQTNQ
jgi:hypothetical protein